MIKVQVPELKPEDVERVRESLEAIAAAVRAMAPVVATLLIQFGQQAQIAAKTFRKQIEHENRIREEARRG